MAECFNTRLQRFAIMRRLFIPMILAFCVMYVITTVVYIGTEVNETVPGASSEVVLRPKWPDDSASEKDLANIDTDPMEERMMLRRSRIPPMCGGKFTSTKNASREPIWNLNILYTSSSIYVDDKYKFLYCFVPKTATTTWRKMFMAMHYNISYNDADENFDKLTKDIGLKHLNLYSEQKILQIMQGYLKFMVVRNPFERLLSAWQNKFNKYKSGQFWYCNTYGKSIIEKYRKNFTVGDGSGCDVTFDEFTDYLLERDFKNGWIDEHWKPYYDLCMPCHVPYDTIIHYETLVEDSNYVLDKLGEKRRFPNGSSGVKGKVLEAYSNLNNSFHKREQIYKIYQMDFDMFGYGPIPLA
ncbi:unnamed protein product [Owenia fusiformis]|uniref:Carbohydrate sulfotransferase n=1 Tax=Owenia fusiformis TaxID=6347 RepID=A0A8S4Q647_OWEFU|nr:unnamed protein product [Owenia fusiformis]